METIVGAAGRTWGGCCLQLTGFLTLYRTSCGNGIMVSCSSDKLSLLADLVHVQFACVVTSSSALSCESCFLSAGVHGPVIHSARCSAVCQTTVSSPLPPRSEPCVYHVCAQAHLVCVAVCVVDFFEFQLNFHQTSGIFSLFFGLYHFLNALSFKLLQYYNFYFVAEPRA